MSSNDGNSNYKTNWWPDGTMPGGSLLSATGDNTNYYGDDKVLTGDDQRKAIYE